MTKHYTAKIDVSLGGDPPTWEGEVDVVYTVNWGRPAMPPAYDHGGLPAEADEVNDITVVRIEGAPVVGEGLKRDAAEIEAYIEANDLLIEHLLELAIIEDGDEAWDEIERQMEPDQ